MKNFYPEQYQADASFPINHNYLDAQFADYKEILRKIESVVTAGDFTLGSEVDRFEANISNLLQSNHVVAVNSGTDAIFLSLYASGVGPGDEVITTAFTFYATIGAIATLGATPVFVDIGADYNIDASKIEDAITERTKAIVPVHWAGRVCQMTEINRIAKKYDLIVVEDACHAICAELNGQKAGTIGDFGCFSLHPLKNLNAWGDGGFICLKDEEAAHQLRLLRNHGLRDRNTCEIYGFNSRLDTVQAVVANHLLTKLDNITGRRIENATYLDDGLRGISGLEIPSRESSIKEVFHLYCFKSFRRDDLIRRLQKHGIDAKIHYPTAMHLQPAAAKLGYSAGDFPIAEMAASTTVSLPVHEFISTSQLDLMISIVSEFHGS